MNRIIKIGMVGVLLALGAAHTQAAKTNYWVQNVNLALTAYVSLDGQLLHGSVPTKQFIAFLSGAPNNPALVSSQTVVQSTNSVYTNLTVLVTNLWLLPAGELAPADFPRSYTVTTNYVLTPDSGVTFYTNNVDFTNDVVVTRTSDTNVTYTFNNAVTVPTNRTAYLFPGLTAASVTAVWTNLGPGTVFALNGWALTDVVGPTTNYTYASNPDFTKQHGAKLLYVTPIVDGTNLASRFVVRYSSGKQNVDTDVSAFMSEYWGSPYLSVSQIAGIGPGAQRLVYAFTEIDFNNGAGTTFNLLGFDTQVWGQLASKGTVISPSVLKQRKMAVGNYGGLITGAIEQRTFKNSPAVVKGTLTISGGKLE